MSNHQNNKRIVKNTLALYFRQIITMVVALFTSRVVLQMLGVTDYGINNVVGGVVTMFSFISGTLMSITQRFITVEIGKGSHISVLRKIFSTSMILHILAVIAVLILAETVGLWFLNNKLVIPAERMIAANWVYQFAVFGFALSLLNAPLMALIISHEDMHIYGYMGIFDVIVRLITVYLLIIVNADKLIFLALCGFVISCVVWIFYAIYCRKKYLEAKFSFVWDKSLMKELGGFGGWVFGNRIFGILLMYGTNIILNIFFGPAVNAAKGLANTVDNALLSFGNNFKQALVPQITKSYSNNDSNVAWNLIEKGTRMTYFLFFIFSIPFLLKAEFILKLWLGNVPEYTAIFVRLIIINALLEIFNSFLWNIANASGKIKYWYSLSYITCAISLTLFYLICKMGYPPYYALMVSPFLKFVNYPIYYKLARKLYGFSIRFFTVKALIPSFAVSAISILPFYFINKVFYDSFLNSCIIIITSILWTGIVIMFIGLRKNERIRLITLLKTKILRNQK